jgi:hypothetical protein
MKNQSIDQRLKYGCWDYLDAADGEDQRWHVAFSFEQFVANYLFIVTIFTELEFR